MATDDTIVKLLELYQKCKMNGEQASLFMETMEGMDTTITFRVKAPAGSQPAGRDSCPRRRWKTPSQLKRDRERKDKFLAKKLEEQSRDKNPEAEATEKVLLVEPKDEIVPEEIKVCEKLYIFPHKEILNHNIGIEYDLIDKLQAKGLTVKKVKVEKLGNPVKGEYVRSEVRIEPADAKLVEKENYEIENCWVLPVI